MASLQRSQSCAFGSSRSYLAHNFAVAHCASDARTASSWASVGRWCQHITSPAREDRYFSNVGSDYVIAASPNLNFRKTQNTRRFRGCERTYSHVFFRPNNLFHPRGEGMMYVY